MILRLARCAQSQTALLDMLFIKFLYSAPALGPELEIATEDPDRTRHAGRLLALDIGKKRVGIAVSDEMALSVRPLPPIKRTSWKKLLEDVRRTIADFDARGLVIGLPVNMDGTEGDAALETRRIARKFVLSLDIPVYLQDERLTTKEAESELGRSRRFSRKFKELRELADSEAAAIILRDFLSKPTAQSMPSSPS